MNPSCIYLKVQSFVLFCALFFVANCGFSETKTIVDGIVAIVGPKVVLKSDVDMLSEQLKIPGMARALFGVSMSKSLSRDELLEFLIQQKIMEVAIEEVGINKTITADDVEGVITRTGIPRDELIQRLKMEGMSYEAYRKRIRQRLEKERFQQQFITPYVKVTPEQIERRFKERFPPESLVTIQLLVLTPDEIKRWSKARKSSQKTWFDSPLPGRAPTVISGYLSEMSPEIATAVAGRTKGYISNVLAIGKQKVVVRVHNIGAAKHDVSSKAFEEKRNEVKTELMIQAHKRYMEKWVRQQKFNLKIEKIRLPHS